MARKAKGPPKVKRWHSVYLESWHSYYVWRIRGVAQEAATEAANHFRKVAREGMIAVGPPRSPPGGYPAIDTGRLVDSIQVQGYQTFDGGGAAVGTDVPYGETLQFGTARVAARPWFTITFAKSWAEMHKIITKTFAEDLL